MRKIITISNRAWSHLLSVRTSWTKTRTLALFATLLSLGLNYTAFGQCTSMSLSNATPVWNGLEFCDNGSGYDPITIQAPIINYVGTCSNTPSYDYQWEYRINGNPIWTTVASGTGANTVPSYNPPNQTHSGSGPSENFQWRLKVQDVANGLTAQSGNFTLILGVPMTLSATSVSPTCFGLTNGSINLTVAGGTTKTYLWNPSGQTTEDRTGIGAGSYTVTVTDAACAAATTVVTVTQPDQLVASSVETTPIACFGGSAVVTVSATGGTLAYTGTGTFSVVAGTYTYTVTDANSCTATTSITVTQPNAKVHNTTQNTHFCRIQEAIDDPNTMNGDIITVDAGTFAEDIVVHKEIKLRGPNYNVSPCNSPRVAEAILVPATHDIYYRIVVEVTADNVEIDGFTIDGDNPLLPDTATIAGTGAGINAAEGVASYTNGMDNLKVKNNVIKNFAFAGVDLFPSGTQSSGHEIWNNQIMDLGTYNSSRPVDNYWGIGVLEYNNAYASIAGNCMTNVRLGVQTGNYHLANLGSAISTYIQTNSIQARSLGIFFNLHYGSATPLEVTYNSITPLANVNETDWNGVLVASHASVNSTVKNNTIIASGFAPYSKGIEVWNVYPATHATLLQENTIIDASLGIFVNNYDGYNSDANGSFANASANNIQNCDTALYVKDNALSSHNLVGLTATNNFVTGSQRGVVFTESQANTVSGVVNENSILGAGPSFDASVANLINGECNWHGATAAASVAAKVIGNVDYTSWLVNGTDGNVAPGFQNTSCSGTPIVIASASTVPETCVSTGSTTVTFSGGTATYTVSWSGVSSGSQTTGTSPNTITGLAAGSYTVTITDVNGSTSATAVTIGTANVYNVTSSTPYNTISAAVAAATAYDVIQVCAGTYIESVEINTPLTLNGPNANSSCAPGGVRVSEATIDGNGNTWAIRINSDNVNVNGFTVTNPTNQLGITINGRSNINVTNNIINQVGFNISTPSNNSSSFGINYETSAKASNVNLSDNCVSNIYGANWNYPGPFPPASPFWRGSATGIGATSSSSIDTVTNLRIERNYITNMVALSDNSVGRGAYGVISNMGGGGTPTTGAAQNLRVRRNEITNLNGRWAHGVGLEGNTPGAIVDSNLMNNFVAIATDNFGVTIQNNVSAATVAINYNSFTNMLYSVGNAMAASVNAECNWHSSSASGIVVSKNAGNVDYNPWLVSGTDANGGAVGFAPTMTCTGTPVVLSETHVDVACGGPTGSIDLTISGGTPAYTIAWSNGSSTEDISALAAGTYSVLVTDVNGSTATISVTITEPANALNATATPSHVDCNGNSTGSVAIAATGGTPGYTVSGNSVPHTFTGLAAGTYTYAVIDANACTYTVTATVTEPPVLTASSSSTSILCNGGTAVVTVSATGGTLSYTGTGTFTVSAGSYTYNVSDANGCTASTTITVTEPSLLVASSAGTPILCNGGTSVVTVSATGGTGAYTGTGTFTVTAGTHSYTVSDANGCTSVTSVTLTEPATLVASSSATPILCNGGNSVVTVSATGGTGAYTGTGTFTVTAGTHSYTVSDANGCTSVTSVTLTEPTLLVASSSSTSILCNGGTAVVTVSATGGTLGYTGTGTFSVVAGTHSYTVSDANGCTSVTSVTVTEPNALVASSSSTSILCNGGTAVVTVSAMGGTMGYTGTGTFTVSAGTHSYTVSDANGCTSVTTITVTQPSAISNINIAVTPITCFGLNNGTAVVSGVTGGTQFVPVGLQLSYNYLWSTGGNGTLENLIAPGTHTLTVTDSNGCTAQQTFVMTQPSLLTATTSVVNHVSCFGDTTGKADVTIAGGTPFIIPPTYMISWTSGGTLNLEEELWAATHTVTVTDANGCTATSTVTITQASMIVPTASVTTPIACNGGSGIVTVSATGGNPGYTGTGTFTVTAGTYTYTVTDATMCTTSVTITVTEPPVLMASSSVTTPIACNGGSAVVTVSATGGTIAYTGTGTFSATAGTHTYTVSDANGCTTTTMITITEPTALSASASVTTPVACNGGSAVVTVSATGGTMAYTGTGTFSATAGTHSYTVSDANGCTTTTSVTVTEPTALAATSTETTPIACNGGSAVVTVSATGGTLAYTGTGTFSAIAGTHTYTVSDANGCTTTTTITLTQPSALSASSSVTTPIACNGGNAVVTVSATGGTMAYTGIGTFSATAGTHTYTVSDANGCATTTTISITEPALLAATASVTTPVACNGGSAVVTVSATGGTMAYTGTGTFSVVAGTHSYTVSDANGCTATTSVTVTEPAVLAASSSVTTPIACNGGSAVVTVSATGGTGAYSGTGTFTASAGTHSYTVSDANGCSTTTSITITEPTALSASSMEVSPILCFGGSATVNVSAAGGTPSYSGTGNQSLPAGTYTLTVNDANGCSATTTITITQPDAVVASSTVSSPVVCNGGTAVVTVSATGGTGAYTGTGTFTVTAGAHSYTVADANGCTGTTTITVTQPAVIMASTSPNVCDSLVWNGNTYTTSGVHTATFTAANGCDSVHTINLTVRYSTSSTTTVSQSLSYTWTGGSGLTYTLSGTYFATIPNAAGCDSNMTLNLTILGVAVNSKAYLCAAYIGGGMMHDSIRKQGSLPLTEPYTTTYGKTPLGGAPAGETTTAGVLAITGAKAVVDWIFVELRDPSTLNVLYNERGLLLADGSITAEDGLSSLVFPTAPVGNYKVSVKHRNHLGIMTANNYLLTLSGVSVDFSTAPLWLKVSNPALVNTPAKTVSGVQVMWPGDARNDKNTKYNGFQNDKDDVLGAAGGALAVTPANYREEDVNLDGVIRYNGLNNDRNFILNTVGVATPNNIYNQHTPD